MNTEQYKKYLPWLSLLVIAKFLWVPVLESRNEHREGLSALQSQIIKTQDVINNKDAFELQKTSLERAIEKVEHRFYHSDDESAFRLEFQKRLEVEAQALNVKVQSITWLEPIRDKVVSWYNLEVVLSGSVDDIAAFHRYLAQSKEQVAISSFSWRTPNTRGRNWQWSIQSNYKLAVPVLEGKEV
ncbi:hypothetical protein G5C64_05220 [Vibrio diabolicus]|uniref:hypothetical protein n=1 Tax=Vibrio TaxID=662 RepID=UPI002151A516|nr:MULTISPECIES: hypothetical protein [Vibrio]MCE3218256.1 hypothetical protein [Vibrio diabolicus]MDW2056777.1 hypothetical protein [Vibrio sp. 506]